MRRQQFSSDSNGRRAFARLDEALQARSAGLTYVHVDPSYEPRRTDPRLSELARKVGVK